MIALNVPNDPTTLRSSRQHGAILVIVMFSLVTILFALTLGVDLFFVLTGRLQERHLAQYIALQVLFATREKGLTQEEAIGSGESIGKLGSLVGQTGIPVSDLELGAGFGSEGAAGSVELGEWLGPPDCLSISPQCFDSSSGVTNAVYVRLKFKEGALGTYFSFSPLPRATAEAIAFFDEDEFLAGRNPYFIVY